MEIKARCYAGKRNRDSNCRRRNAPLAQKVLEPRARSAPSKRSQNCPVLVCACPLPPRHTQLVEDGDVSGPNPCSFIDEMESGTASWGDCLLGEDNKILSKQERTCTHAQPPARARIDIDELKSSIEGESQVRL